MWHLRRRGLFCPLAAPKAVIYVSNVYDWRYAFVIAGGLGILWLLPWFLIFRKPETRAPRWEARDAAQGQDSQDSEGSRQGGLRWAA